VVVIGASAGGVAALRTIVSQLPSDLPAAVLVVLHIGVHRSHLASVLRNAGRIAVETAADGAPLRPGCLHVAPPDHHLLLHDGSLRLTRGPKEHHTRPAIDPLFRSAALVAGTRVIGVVLSGCNADGTAGLQAIKACGGAAIVQDPADAEEPAMPQSALKAVRVDHCLPLDRIAPTLVELAGQPAHPAAPAPEPLVNEHAVSLAQGNPMEHLGRIGTPSVLTCPDCHGTLYELNGTQPMRLRCHTGHAYTMRTLEEAQDTATEEALWSAIRALKEKETLMRKMAELDRLAGDEEHARLSDRQADRIARQVLALRQFAEEIDANTAKV